MCSSTTPVSGGRGSNGPGVRGALAVNEEGYDFAIRGPAWHRQRAPQRGHLRPGPTARAGHIQLKLAGLFSIRQESYTAAIRGPSEVVLVPRGATLSTRDPSCRRIGRTEIWNV